MIAVQGVCLEQGEFHLRDLSFAIDEGAYAVLMGHSGCGKTTILEFLCGLRPITAGQIFLSGIDVTRLQPAERGIGYVPQDRALFPNYLVRDQLAFSLLLRKFNQNSIARRVDELAALLGITHLLDRMPDGLSGGEAQRVALGRALACRPSVLCLDEPLSALDEDLHDEMCELLIDVHRHTKVTVLHITHSGWEAKRLGQIILRMESGTLTPIPPAEFSANSRGAAPRQPRGAAKADQARG